MYSRADSVDQPDRGYFFVPFSPLFLLNLAMNPEVGTTFVQIKVWKKR